jgi:2'-5' RNA ligase
VRLFASIIPDEPVLDHLENTLDHVLPPATMRLRQPRATWHITLAFYGEVAENLVDPLCESFREIVASFPAPTLELKGAGLFANRMAWAGVTAENDQLRPLMSDLSVLREDYGLAVDSRQRNRSHLTFSRHGEDSRIAAAVKALSIYQGPVWTASQAIMFRSDLGQGVGGHPHYEPIMTVEFASADN